MKKNVLIISSNLGIGGFQKSLISLLHYFDYNNYNVDLLIFRSGGVFENQIPSNVNLIHNKMPGEYFESFAPSVKKLFKLRRFGLVLIRLLISIIGLFDKGYAAIFMSKFIPKIDKEYDVSIDYNGQYILYYMINKIKAKRKITFFHSDYKMWSFYKRADERYYRKVDFIVTVSDLCVDSLKDYFPSEIYKIKRIENIITKETVNSTIGSENSFQDKFDGIRLLTVGRVCKEKGIDMAIEACRYLKHRGLDFKWYVVGQISDEKYFGNLINENDVVNEFVLLGATNNPYTYMKESDIIVHTSRFEGKAVVIEEAKVLNKPIIVTDFSTAKNQITNRKTGLIVNMDSESIANGILEVINNKDLREDIISELSKECNGNENEIKKLYQLMR